MFADLSLAAVSEKPWWRNSIECRTYDREIAGSTPGLSCRYNKWLVTSFIWIDDSLRTGIKTKIRIGQVNYIDCDGL